MTERVIKDAENLVGRLAFGELLGPTGTIARLRSCRLDRQPPPPGGSNIQVQLNDVRGKSTVATCVIDAKVISSMSDWPSGLQRHQQEWLLRQIRVALHWSLEKKRMFRIMGSFNDPDNLPSLTPRQEQSYRLARPANPSEPRDGGGP
jgi:hypothetical protein